MIFYAQLAARNVARNVRRTLLSMGSVIAGVAVIVLGRSFIGGIEENIIRSQVDALSGHLEVLPVEYPTVGITHPVDELFQIDSALRQAVEAQHGVLTTRLLFAPRAIHKGDAIRIRAIGFDPATDAAVFPRDNWRCTDATRVDVKGCDGMIPTTAAEGVLIADNVGALLELKPGDRMFLEVRTFRGAINALEVPVSGVFSTGNNALDRFGVFVPKALADDLVQADGHVSHLLVRFPQRDDAFAAKDALAGLLPAGTEAHTWYDDCREMLELQQIRRTALNIVVAILMVISALGIANTILMAAYERVREIGTLRAMGMNRGGVIGLFIAEGAVMGFVGGVIGALIGGAMTWHWSTVGIDLTGGMKDAGTVAISSMLYTEFSPPTLLGSIVFGALVAMAGSIWPAFVASSMQPADAVRA